MKFQKRVWRNGDYEWKWEARVLSGAGFLLDTVSGARTDSRDKANAAALNAVERLKSRHRSRWVTVEEMS